MYHTDKSCALVCGCGFGDICSHRFLTHLRKMHNVVITPIDATESHFWHDIPVFERIYKCDNKKYDCQFRTPFKRLMSYHSCKQDNTPSQYPKYDEFLKYLPKYQYPVFGFPVKQSKTCTRNSHSAHSENEWQYQRSKQRKNRIRSKSRQGRAESSKRGRSVEISSRQDVSTGIQGTKIE